MKAHLPYRMAMRGQSAVEYAIVTAILTTLLGMGWSNDPSVLKQLFDAFSSAYRLMSFALSMP